MKPTKITLEIVPSSPTMKKYAPTTARLRVESLEGSTVIESTPLATGKSLPRFRKQGEAYSKRFAVPFIDATV